MRTFTLHRDEDPTGISGTGVVAQAVEFDDGTVALRWLGDSPTTVIHRSMLSVASIHCHGGHTRIVLDEAGP